MMGCTCEIAKTLGLILGKLEKIEADVSELKSERQRKEAGAGINNNNSVITANGTPEGTQNDTGSGGQLTAPTIVKVESLFEDETGGDYTESDFVPSTGNQQQQQQLSISCGTTTCEPFQQDEPFVLRQGNKVILRVQGIAYRTMEEEEQRIEQCLEEIRKATPLGYGATIPRHQNIAYEIKSDLELGVVFMNYLDVSLVNPRTWFEHCGTKMQIPPPPLIIGGTKEMTSVQPSMKRTSTSSPGGPHSKQLIISSSSASSAYLTTPTTSPFQPNDSVMESLVPGTSKSYPGSYQQQQPMSVAIPYQPQQVSAAKHSHMLPYTGLISYDIGSTDMSIICFFSICKNQRRYGIALAPRNTCIDAETLSFLNKYHAKFRDDIGIVDGPHGDKRTIYVQNKRILAKAIPSVISTYNFSCIMPIEIGSVSGLQNVPFIKAEISPSVDLLAAGLESCFKDANSRSDIECLDDPNACVVEIRNALQVKLDVPLVNQELAAQDRLLQRVIAPFGRTRSCFQNIRLATVYMVSYRVQTTDIRLSIAFQKTPIGNYFGVEFLPLEAIPWSPLYLLPSSANSHDWKEKSYSRFASAGDGTITLQYRNLVAQARMTKGMNAFVEVIVTSI